jgi:hypothetical protein
MAFQQCVNCQLVTTPAVYISLIKAGAQANRVQHTYCYILYILPFLTEQASRFDKHRHLVTILMMYVNHWHAL